MSNCYPFCSTSTYRMSSHLKCYALQRKFARKMKASRNMSFAEKSVMLVTVLGGRWEIARTDLTKFSKEKTIPLTCKSPYLN